MMILFQHTTLYSCARSHIHALLLLSLLLLHYTTIKLVLWWMISWVWRVDSVVHLLPPFISDICLVCFSIIAMISFDSNIIYDVLNCWFAYGYFRLCKNSCPILVNDYDLYPLAHCCFEFLAILIETCFLAFLLQYFLRFIGIFVWKLNPFSRYLRWYLHSSHRKCVQLIWVSSS